jgi:hypothetical protein
MVMISSLRPLLVPPAAGDPSDALRIRTVFNGYEIVPVTIPYVIGIC